MKRSKIAIVLAFGILAIGSAQRPTPTQPTGVCERNNPGWRYENEYDCPTKCWQVKYHTGSSCRRTPTGNCIGFDGIFHEYYERPGQCYQDENSITRCRVTDNDMWSIGGQVITPTCQN